MGRRRGALAGARSEEGDESCLLDALHATHVQHLREAEMRLSLLLFYSFTRKLFYFVTRMNPGRQAQPPGPQISVQT